MTGWQISGKKKFNAFLHFVEDSWNIAEVKVWQHFLLENQLYEKTDITFSAKFIPNCLPCIIFYCIVFEVF